MHVGLKPFTSKKLEVWGEEVNDCLFFFFNIFIYLFVCFWLRWVFVAAHGLFSSCGERGLLFVAVRGLLIVVASLVVEHRL